MYEKGKVQVFFTDEPDAGTWAHLFFTSENGEEVFFAGSPVQVQGGKCLSFSPAVIEVSTEAGQDYEAGTPPDTGAVAPPVPKGKTAPPPPARPGHPQPPPRK